MVHLVFHIVVLKKCLDDPSLLVSMENVDIQDNLRNEEVPFYILDRQVCKLRIKEVDSVKFFWSNQFIEEATWEAEEDMKNTYPYLFE